MEVKAMSTTIDYSIVNAADTTQALTVFTTIPNIYILDMFARVKTAFAGITTPTVKLGDEKVSDLFIHDQCIGIIGDLITKKEIAYLQPHNHPIKCSSKIGYQKIPLNVGMVATFTSQSENWSAATAGEIEFVCVYAE